MHGELCHPASRALDVLVEEAADPRRLGPVVDHRARRPGAARSRDNAVVAVLAIPSCVDDGTRVPSALGEQPRGRRGNGRGPRVGYVDLHGEAWLRDGRCIEANAAWRAIRTRWQCRHSLRRRRHFSRLRTSSQTATHSWQCALGRGAGTLHGPRRTTVVRGRAFEHEYGRSQDVVLHSNRAPAGVAELDPAVLGR